MKRSLLFSLCLFLTVCLSGQSSYGLLWEVTHPDLAGPSYVFGTMHVNDPPVFELGDSVWHAIHTSDVFAMEVSLDSIRAYACNAGQDSETEDVFRSPFSRGRGRGKGGSAPVPIKLDQYLLLVARDAGKRLDGLEPIHGRDMELAKMRSDEGNDYWSAVFSYRRLLNAYAAGDLDAVEEQFAPHVDAHLIRRNHLMVESIKRIARHERLFAAVGVGHLIGDEGIPALLRADGFTVRQMQPGEVTKPMDLSLLESLDDNWVQIEEPTQGYSVQMPGEPCSYFSDEGVAMKMYLDGVTEQIYGIGVLPHDITMRTRDFRKSISQLVEEQTTDGSKPSVRNFSYAGMKGLEVRATIRDFEVTYRYLMRDGIIYFILYGNEIGFRWEHLREKFLNSLTFSTPDRTWSEFVHEPGAYKVRFPGQPQYIPFFQEEVIDGMMARYDIHIHYAVDPDSKVQYLVRYNDMPPGMFASEDSIMAAETIYVMDEHLGVVEVLGERTESLRGYTSVWRAVTPAGGGYAEYQLILRGNRNYLLLLQATSDKSVDPGFMESFDLIDFQAPQLKMTTLDDGEFSLLFTDETYIEIDSGYYDYMYVTEKVDVFSARDNQNGAVILVERLMTSPYEVADRSDSTERAFQYAIVDSAIIQSIEEVTMSGYPAWRINGRDGKNNLDVMYQYFRLEHYIYGIRVMFPIEIDGITYADSIFNSFVLHREPELYRDIPKGTLMLEHLRLQDTVLRNKAEAALPYVVFTHDEQDLLEHAILRSWPDDTLSSGVRSHLLTAYLNLMKSDGIPFIRTFLSDTMMAKPFVAGILSGLSEIRDSAAIEYFFTIMDSPGLAREEIYWGNILAPFIDSAQMAVTYFHQLLPYADDMDAGADVIRAFSSAVQDSAAGILTLISDHTELFTGVLTSLADSLERTPDTLWQRYLMIYHISSLFDLLVPAVGIHPMEPYLRRMAATESGYLRRDCVLELMRAGLDVDRTLFETVLGDTTNAPYFVFSSVKDSLFHHIPDDLYHEADIAYFDIHNLLSDEYDMYHIEPFGTREIRYRDQDARIYLYKLKFEDEDADYLGISGPFPVMPHSEYYNILTDFNFTELTRNNLDELVQSILAVYLEE